MRKIILLLFFSIFSVVAWAQQMLNVKGTVKDGKNIPIEGATVTLKGSRSATGTDAGGHFAIDVSRGDILQVSYVGMQSYEQVINDDSFLSIVLEDGSALDEVVVIGYGTVKKKDLTGAVASVSGKDLQSNLAKNTTGALQGRVAGVSVTNSGGAPGAGLNVTIRGLSSFGSDLWFACSKRGGYSNNEKWPTKYGSNPEGQRFYGPAASA
jgi:outer membrane receptor protein involved in Fe transport